MKIICAAIDSTCDPSTFRIIERELPTLLSHEVQIKIFAAGINRPDVLQRQGRYPAPPGTVADVPGLEVSGEIVDVGDHVTRFKIGDRVCALVPGGGYSTGINVHEETVLPIPDHIDYLSAACMPETFFTVWYNVFELGRLEAGDHLLVHGGSSGIGTTAILLGKAFGGRISVTVGSLEKAEACLQLGADQVILYKSEDFASALADDPPDVILDMIGGNYFTKNMEIIADDGRLIYINAMNGHKVELDIFKMMRKRILVTGSTLRNRPISFKAAIRSQLETQVWPKLYTHNILPPIYKVYPLEEAMQAHLLMESSKHIGKIVLSMK
jgi:NADPH2:quinone reductase